MFRYTVRRLFGSYRGLSDPLYSPRLDKLFDPTQPIPFKVLSDAFEQVQAAQGLNSRQEVVRILTNLFHSVLVLRQSELVPCFYLSLGKFCPDYLGISVGVGDSTLIKAVANITHLPILQIKDKFRSLDSLVELFPGQNSAVCTVEEVYSTLWRLSGLKGPNSLKAKEEHLMILLKKADAVEAKYIVSLIQQKLRIGASEATMVKALARSFALYQGSSEYSYYEQEVSSAINQSANYETLIHKLCEGPIAQLAQTSSITPGIPVKAMLAAPVQSLSQAISRFKNIEIAYEYKYDGIRAQIHLLSDNTIKIFSRTNEELTSMFPDVVAVVQKHLHTLKNCILDAELVAYDRESQSVLGFQYIQKRNRKDVATGNITIHACLYVFDLLYINDCSLLNSPLRHRRTQLTQHIPQLKGELVHVPAKLNLPKSTVTEYLQEAVENQCEGLMIKSFDSVYEPGKRSFCWLKLKKDYIEEFGLADSIDVVIIGADHGTGKRAGSFGSFLCAVYDPVSDSFQSLCKLGTGLSDLEFAEVKQLLQTKTIPTPLQNYSIKVKAVDVWFEASVVISIRGADLSVSPVHTAGSTVLEHGLSLRFPRFVAFRSDKSPAETTSPQELLQLLDSSRKIS